MPTKGEIDIRVAIGSNGVRRETWSVLAQRTSSPLFAIHPTYEGWEEAGYTVTHIPTGYSAAVSVPSKDAARKVAAAFAAIPLRWGNTDPVKLVVDAPEYKALPPELKKWMRSFLPAGTKA